MLPNRVQRHCPLWYTLAIVVLQNNDMFNGLLAFLGRFQRRVQDILMHNYTGRLTKAEHISKFFGGKEWIDWGEHGTRHGYGEGCSQVVDVIGTKHCNACSWSNTHFLFERGRQLPYS